MRTPIIVSPSDDGGFTVQLPGSAACVSAGATVQEAVQKATAAVAAHQLENIRPVELSVPDGGIVMFVSILDAGR